MGTGLLISDPVTESDAGAPDDCVRIQTEPWTEVAIADRPQGKIRTGPNDPALPHDVPCCARPRRATRHVLPHVAGTGRDYRVPMNRRQSWLHFKIGFATLKKILPVATHRMTGQGV